MGEWLKSQLKRRIFMDWKCPQCGGPATVLSLHGRSMWCDTCGYVNLDFDFNSGAISSPENAALIVDQDLLDADETRKIAFTAHTVADLTAYNVWVCTEGEWLKVIPEQTLDGTPSIHALVGQLNRYVLQPEMRYFSATQDQERWYMIRMNIQMKFMALMGQLPNS